MANKVVFAEQDITKFKKVKAKCFVSVCPTKAVQHGLCHQHLVIKRRYQLSNKRLEELCTTPCQICGATKHLHIDHDTECCQIAYWTCGQCIKGVVCKDCNNVITISSFKVDLLEKAIEYLKSRE